MIGWLRVIGSLGLGNGIRFGFGFGNGSGTQILSLAHSLAYFIALMEKEDRGGLLYRILCVSSMLLYVFLLGE